MEKAGIKLEEEQKKEEEKKQLNQNPKVPVKAGVAKLSPNAKGAKKILPIPAARKGASPNKKGASPNKGIPVKKLID